MGNTVRTHHIVLMHLQLTSASISAVDLGIDTWQPHMLGPPIVINIRRFTGHFALAYVTLSRGRAWITMSLCHASVAMLLCSQTLPLTECSRRMPKNLIVLMSSRAWMTINTNFEASFPHRPCPATPMKLLRTCILQLSRRLSLPPILLLVF